MTNFVFYGLLRASNFFQEFKDKWEDEKDRGERCREEIIWGQMQEQYIACCCLINDL